MLFRKPDFTSRPRPATLLLTCRLLFLLNTVLIICQAEVLCQQRNPPVFNPNEMHGGIEIAPRMVRAIALRISNGEEGYNIKVLHYDQAALLTAPSGDAKLSAENIRDLVQSAQRQWEKLQRDFRIPPEQIYLIGLSDLPATYRDDIARRVLDGLGKEITFLDTESEVQLSIAGSIPRRYKSNGRWYENRSLALLLDIGNTSIRGGYQQIRQTSSGGAEYDFVTFDIPTGSESLRALIRAEAVKKPGLTMRKKIYLTGNVISALAALLYPEDLRAYVPVTIEDIIAFHRRATTDPDALLNPDLSKIPDEGTRNEARRNREAIKALFTPKTLASGAEALKAVASELNLEDRRMVYARNSYLARIMSYVRLQPD